MTSGYAAADNMAGASAAPPAAAQAAPLPDYWPSRGGAWYAVVMLGLISVMSNIDRGIVSLLVQPIKRDLQLSDTQMSLIIGLAFSFFYMCVGLPMSRVADVRSRKVILTCGLTAWSLATALAGFARSFTGLFAARGVLGAAESTMGPSAMSMIADLVPRERLPRAMSIYSAGIVGGMAFSMILGGLLLGFVREIGPIRLPGIGAVRDWQMVFFLCGLPGLLLAIVFALTVGEPVRRGRKVQGPVPLRTVGAFLWSHKAIYLPMFIGAAVHSIEAFGLVAWRVPFYERTYGWGPSLIGPLVGTINLVSMPIGLVLGTLLAEHFTRRRLPDAMLRVPLIGGLLSLPLYIAGPLMPTAPGALAVSALAGVLASIGSPASISAIAIITPNEMRGQLNAIYLFTISVIGSGLGPTVVALVTDFVLTDESMLRYAMVGTVGVLAPIGSLLTFLAMKPYGRAVTRILEEEAAGA